MIADRIRSELDKAKQHDEEARQHRQRAGELLRGAGDWLAINTAARAAGIDPRMLQLLISMPPTN